MSAQNAIWAAIVALFAIIQYALTWHALRDLVRRPRVRGGNKMAWALLILCAPIIGPLFYSWNGPTSFRQADPVASWDDLDDELLDYIEHNRPARPANVTHIRQQPTTISARTPAQRPGLTRSRAHNTAARPRSLRRYGA